MSTKGQDINIKNSIKIANADGQSASLQGISHYDASSLFSDTVDLPTSGYPWINEAGDISIIPVGSTTALTYTIEIPRELPIKIKRIMSTNTTVTEVYIWN